MDMNSHIQKLLVTNPIRQSILLQMVRTLRLPRGSQGLDAGCGTGHQCLLLAEEVGSGGHVTGLDISRDMLDYGREMVKKADLSARITFQGGDVIRLPFKDNTFDWVWSVDCAGLVPPEPLSSLRELVRVVRPGGILAIAAWSSEKLLPGYPGLEARLGATADGIAPFIQGNKPEWHFLRALAWFNDLGLSEVKVKIFADSFHAPLNHKIRNALAELFRERWSSNVASELSSDDLAEFQRLCLPDSPDFILNLPDYYAFFTYTMFWAKVS